MNITTINDTDSISNLLIESDKEDLDVLASYITNNGAGRLTLEDDVCKRLCTVVSTDCYSKEAINDICNEVYAFGGNSLANAYRSIRIKLIFTPIYDILPDIKPHIPYHEIVRDVASHLDVSFNKDSDLVTIEDAILRKIFIESFNTMSTADREQVLKDLGILDISALGPLMTAAAIVAGRMAGFSTYKMALIVANAIARQLIGKGLTLAANRVLTRSIGVMLGPIGWIFTGLWAIADLASPAYRVTVPCVLQIAYMRQKALLKISSLMCPSCGESNLLSSKFCCSCGKALTASADEPTQQNL